MRKYVVPVVYCISKRSCIQLTKLERQYSKLYDILYIIAVYSFA